MWWKKTNKAAKKKDGFANEEEKRKALEEAERRGQEFVESFRKMMNEHLDDASRRINAEVEKRERSSDDNKRKDKKGDYER